MSPASAIAAMMATMRIATPRRINPLAFNRCKASITIIAKQNPTAQKPPPSDTRVAGLAALMISTAALPASRISASSAAMAITSTAIWLPR